MSGTMIESIPWFLAEWFRSCWIPALGLALACLVMRPLLVKFAEPAIRKWLGFLTVILGLNPWFILAGLPGLGEPGSILDHELDSLGTTLVSSGGAGIITMAGFLAFLGMIPGLGVVIGRGLVSWHMVQGSRQASTRVHAIFMEQCRSLGLKDVRVLENQACPGPATWGWRNPVVLYPEELAERLNDHEIALVFRHELAHIREEDVLFSVILEVLAGIFWFVPLVWILKRHWQTDAEHGADALAAGMPDSLHGHDGSMAEYGRTLISVLEWQNGRASLSGARAMAAPARQVRSRLLVLGNGIARRKKVPTASAVSGTGMGRTNVRKLVRILGLVLAVLVPGTNLASCITYAPGQAVPESPDMSRESLYQKAAACNARMDWTGAGIMYARVLRDYPGDEQASLVLARILIQKKRHDQALSVLAGIKKESPSSHTLRGRIMDFEGRRDEACREYEAALGFPAPHEANRTFALAGLESPMVTPKIHLADTAGFVELTDRRDWSVEVEGSGSISPLEFAIDPKVLSRWESDRPMAPGMAFILDLGSGISLGAVVFNDDASGGTIWTDDYPRSWTIEISGSDGEWHEIGGAEGRADHYASALGQGRECRKIRINQLGRTNGEHWSIYDIEVFCIKETVK